MRFCTKVLIATVCVAALPGCQSLFPGHSQAAQATLPEADMEGYFEQRLADGRVHLLANRPGSAVVAFRQASYGAPVRARAFNGLAIAYDRLGRADLAQRYFMAAMELEPENASFAANFLRFNETLASARAVDAVAVAQAEALLVGTVDQTEDSEAILAEGAPAAERVQRISSNEVRIAAVPGPTRQPGAAQSGHLATRDVRRDRQVSTQNRDYPVRVELAAPQDRANPARPRVTIEGQENSARNRQRSRVTFSHGPRPYPVRVTLDQS